MRHTLSGGVHVPIDIPIAERFGVPRPVEFSPEPYPNTHQDIYYRLSRLRRVNDEVLQWLCVGRDSLRNTIIAHEAFREEEVRNSYIKEGRTYPTLALLKISRPNERFQDFMDFIYSPFDRCPGDPTKYAEWEYKWRARAKGNMGLALKERVQRFIHQKYPASKDTCPTGCSSGEFEEDWRD